MVGAAKYAALQRARIHEQLLPVISIASGIGTTHAKVNDRKAATKAISRPTWQPLIIFLIGALGMCRYRHMGAIQKTDIWGHLTKYYQFQH